MASGCHPQSGLGQSPWTGDHSGLYPELVEYMVARELAVHTFDLRGNGRPPDSAPMSRALKSTWQTSPASSRSWIGTTRAVRSFFSETAWAGSSPSTTRPAGLTACVG